MSDRDESDYEVGYGKPPRATRWKKGQSGNPNGRPKAPKDFATAVEQLLLAPPPGSGGSGQSSQEILIRRAVVDAMKGDQRSFRFIIARAKRCGLIVPFNPDDDESIGLLVPGMATAEEEERAFRAQEVWRTRRGLDQAKPRKAADVVNKVPEK
jgi:hypothetical protein